MALTYIGYLLLLIGAIWLVIISLQTGQSTGEKILWAIVNLICQPIGGIIFYIVKKQGLVPLLMVVAGAILTGIGSYSLAQDAMQNMPR